MNQREAWELARKVMRHFMACYGDVMDSAVISVGLEPSNGLLVIIPAYIFEPDPISAARLRKRIPYNSPVYYDEHLVAVKNAGFIEEVLEGEYILNQRGHDAFRKIMDTAYQQMKQLSILSSTKLEELKLLLGKLVQASILSPEQICKWSVLHSRRLDPGRKASPIITIDQYLSDLSSYRDDAHLASWSPHSIDAHAWDILGILWKCTASSPTAVIESVKKRRWTESETLTAINELIKKGWITKRDALSITDKGRQVRDNAEELTDKFFFSPWHILTGMEYERMCELLTQLNENFGKLKQTTA